MVAKTNSQRQKASDERQRELGRVGRKVWATPKEHEAVKLLLEQMRFEQESLERAKAINLRTAEIDRD